jgi:hypothetical protein
MFFGSKSIVYHWKIQMFLCREICEKLLQFMYQSTYLIVARFVIATLFGSHFIVAHRSDRVLLLKHFSGHVLFLLHSSD